MKFFKFFRPLNAKAAEADQKKSGRRSYQGFTLVELVVVIAVLAILAGVGSVAYRGYIKKANEAADLELLSAVNTAFQAACAEETGAYPPQAEAALAGKPGAKTVESVTSSSIENLDETFQKYFKGNDKNEFKVYNSLVYDAGNGVFNAIMDDTVVLANGTKMTIKDNGNGTKTFTVKGKDGKEQVYQVADDDINKFNLSSYGTNMTMGELMGEVDNVVSAVAPLVKDSAGLASLVFGDEALQNIKNTLKDKGIVEGTDEYGKALATAIVMRVANDCKGLSKEQILAGQLGSDASMATGAAIGYARATAYANSPAGKASKITVGGKEMTFKEYYDSVSKRLGSVTSGTEGFSAVMELSSNLEKDPNYQAYLESEEGKQDIDGFLGAMNVINQNSSTLEDADIYSKGFADEELDDILNTILGYGK